MTKYTKRIRFNQLLPEQTFYFRKNADSRVPRNFNSTYLFREDAICNGIYCNCRDIGGGRYTINNTRCFVWVKE